VIYRFFQIKVRHSWSPKVRLYLTTFLIHLHGCQLVKLALFWCYLNFFRLFWPCLKCVINGPHSGGLCQQFWRFSPLIISGKKGKFLTVSNYSPISMWIDIDKIALRWKRIRSQKKVHVIPTCTLTSKKSIYETSHYSLLNFFS
jgi:hypothetical protein